MLLTALPQHSMTPLLHHSIFSFDHLLPSSRNLWRNVSMRVDTAEGKDAAKVSNPRNFARLLRLSKIGASQN